MLRTILVGASQCFFTGEYRLYSGNSSRVPCESLYPSCKGKSDGYHHGFEGVTSFLHCFKERFLNTGLCEEDTLWDISKIPYEGKCTNPFEVPYKSGGLLPSCDGKSDGNYRFTKSMFYRKQQDHFEVGRQCDAYYRCKGGVATAIKCPNGTVFESLSRDCQPGNHSIELGCQLYCNPDFQLAGLPKNLAECPYPEQFSEVTQRCENFTKVTCGPRPNVKDICEYFKKFIVLYTLYNKLYIQFYFDTI